MALYSDTVFSYTDPSTWSAGLSKHGQSSTDSLVNSFVKAGNTITGQGPDGVGVVGKPKGNTIQADFNPKTTERAMVTDKPFSTGQSGSRYYSDSNKSESYAETGAGKEVRDSNGNVKTKKGVATGRVVTLGERPYSVFNKYSLVNYRGNPLDIFEPDSTDENGFSGGNGAYQRVHANSLINPTASKIIEITGKSGDNYAYRYQYSDFALTKFYGKIPNNMMLTLRRFAYPAPDDIITPKGLANMSDDPAKPKHKMVPITQPDIARAVTWFGEGTGNAIGDIVKFSHGFNWKDAEAAVQTINSSGGNKAGKVGSFISNNRFLSAAANGAAGRGAVETAAKERSSGYDSMSDTYPNHVFGPLNIIKNVLIREQGLKFSQEFTLKFEYELKSFEGASPKVMMLDQLANLLALTYNNAPFWGGSVRYVGGGSGGSVVPPLGNLNKLKSGDYAGFLGSVIEDLGKTFESVLDPANWKNLGKNKMLNNLIGGPLMKMFNTPGGGQAAQSLLTGDPTGQWHLTVGNPLNPIMVLGNLAMTDCDIAFEGANTIEDFPEKLVATIKLKPARPRDKAEIESMFNAGRGRFYVQPDDVADINRTADVSAYGNKDTTAKPTKDSFVNIFRKISNG